MAAINKLISVTEKATGVVYAINAAKIVKMYGINSDAETVIDFDNNGANTIQMTVDETPAAVNTAADMTIAVTQNGNTVYINHTRIIDVAPSGTGSNIVYLDNKSLNESLIVTENVAAVVALVAAL